MADPVTREAISRLDPVDYKSTLRPTLRTGDLFFASGNYVGSRLIRYFTDSVWSHVGLIVRLPSLGRVLLLESVEDMGVRFAPLSKYLESYVFGKGYDGMVMLARHNAVTDDAGRTMADFGVNCLTKPYDWREVVKIYWRIVRRRGRPQRDDRYICSELVYECFAQAGLPFRYDSKGYISPGQIWADEHVQPLGRVL